MVDRIEAFRSTQVQAVSVSRAIAPFQLGVHHSLGQPDQGAGRMTVGGGVKPPSPSTTTWLGSPGRNAGGPTVAGGTSAGSLGLGSSGGRIARRRSTPTMPMRED